MITTSDSTEIYPPTYTSFAGYQRIATGSLQANALAVKHARESRNADAVLVFDDATGRTLDIDTRGSDEAVLERLLAAGMVQAKTSVQASTAEQTAQDAEPRGRGRPKLGVVPREVTLLPRHWEWLAMQPGGASVALRKLVEEARRAGSDKDRQRKAQERSYYFMQTIAGDLPGFEEASRALFANDLERLQQCMAAWPADVRSHALLLAQHEAA
ncbi:DUF2239 family protein [Lampropedia aestuarii]|uniref:DUF2239 family protein n=1 Tax=Lampropedia aestuarii TaxID=2562762 RepID=UPI0024697361|nr:DUF2239 family protein [Lampropedia aestuarii]MDH5856018.1 DUF2239 family protein [Lampropedia aestuarii]